MNRASLRRVIVNHCWTGHPGYAWYPGYAQALLARGVEVEVPRFPRPDRPRLQEWQDCLREHVDGCSPSSTVLIGHSLGAWNILKFLENHEGEPFARVILVAPVIDQLGLEPVDAFTAAGLCPRPSVDVAEECWALLSPDDPYLGNRWREIADVLVQSFGANLMLLRDRGHFSEGSGIHELPELSELTLRPRTGTP